MNGSLVFKRILFSKKEKDCASRMVAERAGSGVAWCGGGASRALGGASCACEPCVDHGAWSWRREPVGPGGQASRPYCNGTRAWRGKGHGGERRTGNIAGCQAAHRAEGRGGASREARRPSIAPYRNGTRGGRTARGTMTWRGGGGAARDSPRGGDR